MGPLDPKVLETFQDPDPDPDFVSFIPFGHTIIKFSRKATSVQGE